MQPPEDEFTDTTVEVTITRDVAGQLKVASAHQACLVVINGARLGLRQPLGKMSLTIGRGSNCGLVLDVDSVSRQHARIEWSGAEHKFADLGSTNGSFVNDSRVGERPLRDGDRIQVGKVLLKYIAGGNIENAYHEEIQRLTRFDGLTGIFNKRHFEETLERELMLARNVPKAISLILFDIDHFKPVNDTWGHTAGDAVLRQVAECVQSTLSPTQILGRVGGEEFAILCPGAEMSEANALAELVRATVEARRFSFEEIVIPTTVSLGVACRPSGSQEPSKTFYQRADERLYVAKGAGRNCVR